MSDKQGACVAALFLLGSSAILGVNTLAGTDTWLATLIALAASIPLYFVYARISRLGGNLFAALCDCFKWLGRAIVVIMCAYAIFLAGLVARNFADFSNATAFPRTPAFFLMLGIIAVALPLAAGRAKCFGRWSVLAFVVIVLMLAFTAVMGIPKMSASGFSAPRLERIPRAALGAFSFPFAELFLLMGVAFTRPKRVFVLGGIIGGVLLLGGVLQTVALIGPLAGELSYSSYIASRVINVGEVLERIEGLSAYSFVLTGIVKAAVCLSFVASGICFLFPKINRAVCASVAAALSLASGLAVAGMDYSSILLVPTLVLGVCVPLFTWLFSEKRLK